MKKRDRLQLKSIRGKTITATGECWVTRKELERIVKRGGARFNNRVTSDTDVLVRGKSDRWKFKDHGTKEERVRQLIQEGKPVLVIHDYAFQALIEKKRPANSLTTVGGVPREWLSPSAKEFVRITKIPGSLDREYTANGRAEQSYLRSMLFSGKMRGICALCGRSIPTALMIAAHIKPRSE